MTTNEKLGETRALIKPLQAKLDEIERELVAESAHEPNQIPIETDGTVFISRAFTKRMP
jgi:hypothetical protein